MLSAQTLSELNRALRDNDIATARRCADAAIARGEVDKSLFEIAAQLSREVGDHPRAVALYLAAVELAPEDGALLAAAGDAMRYTGQLTEAVALFDRAIACAAHEVAAWYGRALAFEAQGMLAEAQRSYVKVTELAPDSAAGFAGLASMQAQRGDIVPARDNATRAAQLGAGEVGTMMALARCAFAEGRHTVAVEQLDALLSMPALSPQNAIIAYGLRGDSFDKLNLADKAFDSYQRANESFVRLHGERNMTPIALNAVRAIEAGLAKLATDEWRAAAVRESDAAGHIFLLGYPRSGTTLVEQIIATIPDIVSLEEAPTFAAAEAYLTEDGVGALARLDEDSLAKLRQEYWAVVARAGINVAGKTFVDMDPLKGAALPLIAKLFPAAKVIIMHRDPRDVVWSCYRHNFIYSPATFEFTTLSRAAAHYDAVMTLIRRCIALFPLQFHILSYEALVRDFDETTAKLCRFLDLPWSPHLRAFGETALSRTVRTASGPQVRQSLFDGTRQWQRYAEHFVPLAPLLDKWIDPGALDKERA